ncbi:MULTISPECIES: trp RNA-binding attenuation protein MtrB [unclassified Gemella]|uniref:trp RNA-binding attenuation protein MtrB n=1 Tax=unclassified Gemella TaxID=2624949 RepID=UPI001C04A408|nr:MULTISPECIES: trp RNA-binding attenuation protein MtrB [unclassified Gemella]MBU0278490.1 trp RNA-binding attenuation protein MtrB [Gemella sp. zg-1178]QWQ39470.1 trp RNA-binding attenuation protein MtrB [Gemella sp. zg-570]
MEKFNYIIIRAEENNVKVITKKVNNEEILEIINKGEVLLLNLQENIVNFKISGKARIISNLDPIISD